MSAGSLAGGEAQRCQKQDDVGILDRAQSASNATFILNFHGIGAALKGFDPGEEPFWVSEAAFEAVLDCVEQQARSRPVAFTFDDGNLSDHAVAAPALRRRGFTATFFVVAGRLGQPAYLSRQHVRDLLAEGFEIGSHGFNHVDWARVGDAELAHELRDAKLVLEELTGTAVRAAAIPFGHYDGRVLRALRRHGYAKAFSSDGGPRLTGAWPTPRRSIRQGITAADLPRLIASGCGLRGRAVNELRLRIKASLRRRPGDASA